MKGSCLCGAIQISASDQTEVNVCHCNMCRRWGGGPFLAVHCGSQVEFSGSLAPARYASSDWAERGFCPVCGTHLFYHLLPDGEYALPVGLFQDDERFQLTEQIFIDHKPDYYALANQTRTLTGAQVFALFGASQD